MFSGLNLAGKFQALVDQLLSWYGTIVGYFDDFRRNTQDLPGSNEPYLLQIREAIGYLPEGNSLRNYLIQLLSNGLVTDTTNLETLRRTIEAVHFAPGEADPRNLSELYSLLLGFRQQVVGPSDPTIAQLLIDLNERSQSLIDGLNSVREQQEILVEEVSTIRLLTLFPTEGPNLMQLAANIAECICRLADELAPTTPDPFLTILDDHPCAAGGIPVMVIRPEDWYVHPAVGYVANPGWINPDYFPAFAVGEYPTYDGETPGTVTVTTWEDSAPNFTREFFVTTDQPSPVVEVFSVFTWQLLTGPGTPGYNPGSIGTDVTNIFKGSTGCELMIVPGVEASYEAFSFQIQDEITYPPAFNVILYIAPPS